MAGNESSSRQFEDPSVGLSVMVATVSTIRLGRVVGPPGWWRFEPVPEGSYALVWPLEEDERTVLRGARAGENGLLYELDAEDRSSRESSLKMYLEAPRDYYVWWTTDERLYAQALEEPAVVREQGEIICVQQYPGNPREPLRAELERLDKLEGKDFHARSEVRHTICHHLLQRHLFHEQRSAPIFDVTPRPLRALYNVELMEWFLRQSMRAAGNDMATLQHAAAMIQAAEKGLTDATLEEKAARLFSGGERWGEQWEVFERFREYTWRCAATGVTPQRYRRSIAMHQGPTDLPQGGTPEASDGGVPERPDDPWLQSALEIREATAEVRNGPAVHPYFQNVTGRSHGLVREGSTLNPVQQNLLVEYFDAYRFGAELRGYKSDGLAGFNSAHDYKQRMAARLADWSASKAQLLAQARRLLECEGRCDRLVLAIARCHADEPDLLERYVHAAALCEAPWWNGLAEAEEAKAPRARPDGTFASAEWPFWTRFKLWLKPLAETAKAAGKVSKMLKERLGAYALAAEQAQRMLDSVARLELALEGREIDATRHVIRCERVIVRVEPSGTEGTARLTLQRAERKPGAPRSVTLRFVKEMADSAFRPPQFVPAAVAGEFKVLLPARSADLEETQRFTASFTALADAVNLAIAVVTVCSEAKTSDKAMAIFDLGKNVVGLVSSLPAALVLFDSEPGSSPSIRRSVERGKSLEGVARALGRADNLIKVYKGLDVLLREESPATFEARQGRAFRASAQRMNDVANVVVAAGSALELTGAAFEAAGITDVLGFSSTLVAGFSTTPWGLVICVGGALVVAASALVFDLAQPWDTRLMQVEKELALACGRQVIEARFQSALKLDLLGAEVSKAWERSEG